MVIEGTYFKEVAYTSVLALLIVGLGICAQKFNWGAHQASENKASQSNVKLSDNNS